MDIDQILEGSYDLHVHTGPDVMPRRLDDLEMAKRLTARGMKGYGIKSHYSCTAGRARLIEQLYPEFTVCGAISLNHAVGGINPAAVLMAAKDGARIVWLPTVDSWNEEVHIAKGIYKIPPGWAKFKAEIKSEPGIRIFENGAPHPALPEVLDLIKQHHMVLATGHISKEEIFQLAQLVRKMNIRKFVVTHPSFPSIALTKEEQKELATEYGAIMEQCFTTPHTGKMSWEEMLANIRYVGPRHCMLSTDLGQKSDIYPDEGMHAFVEKLVQANFSAEEIKVMIKENPEFLLFDEGEE